MIRIKPHTIYFYLKPLSYEVILLIIILSGSRIVQRWCQDFLFVHDGQHIHLSGEDLLNLGVKPGPHYKKILIELLYARIDGKIITKEEELEMAQKLAHAVMTKGN